MGPTPLAFASPSRSGRRAAKKILVLASTVFVDGKGATQDSIQVITKVAAASSAPVFSFWASVEERGIVGGSLLHFEDEGHRAGQEVLRVLAGGAATAGALARTPSIPTVDWRQLERWHLDPALLPLGSRVLHRPQSMWEAHRNTVLGGLTAILVMAGLSLTLALENRRRRLAELRATEEEARFVLAIQSSGVGVWDYDMKQDRMRWDDTMLRLFQVDRPAFLGNYEAFAGRVLPEDRERTSATLQAARTGQGPFEIEFRTAWPGGSKAGLPKPEGSVSAVRGATLPRAGWGLPHPGHRLRSGWRKIK